MQAICQSLPRHPFSTSSTCLSTICIHIKRPLGGQYESRLVLNAGADDSAAWARFPAKTCSNAKSDAGNIKLIEYTIFSSTHWQAGLLWLQLWVQQKNDCIFIIIYFRTYIYCLVKASESCNTPKEGAKREILCHDMTWHEIHIFNYILSFCCQTQGAYMVIFRL